MLVIEMHVRHWTCCPTAEKAAFDIALPCHIIVDIKLVGMMCYMKKKQKKVIGGPYLKLNQFVSGTFHQERPPGFVERKSTDQATGLWAITRLGQELMMALEPKQESKVEEER